MDLTVIGHKKLRDQFKQMIQAKRFAQSVLFYGADGIGKKMVALEVAHQLTKSTQDIFVVSPTPPKSASEAAKQQSIASNWTIKIEQIQELKKKLVYQPLDSSHQVIIIEHAEKMTRTTANALLKTLEEPRPHQVFILTTHHLNQLLPTIRSRCLRYFFAPLACDDVKTIIEKNGDDLLQGVSDQSLAFLLECFQSSPGMVMGFLKSQVSLDDLHGLTKPAQNFLTISEKVKEILATGLELPVLLQIFKTYKLHHLKESEQTWFEDTEYFDKLQAAHVQHARHLSKEQILENLFL